MLMYDKERDLFLTGFFAIGMPQYFADGLYGLVNTAIVAVAYDHEGGRIFDEAVEYGVIPVPPAIVVHNIVSTVRVYEQAPAQAVVAYAGLFVAIGFKGLVQGFGFEEFAGIDGLVPF